LEGTVETEKRGKLRIVVGCSKVICGGERDCSKGCQGFILGGKREFYEG